MWTVPCSSGDLESVVQAEKDLERLDSMARELSAIGSVQLMVDAIHHLQGKQDADRLRGAGRAHPPTKTEEELEAQQVQSLLPIMISARWPDSCWRIFPVCVLLWKACCGRCGWSMKGAC